MDIDENPARVNIFIDGNNLYHRIKELGLRTKIDIGHLALKLVGDRKLEHIYYYNAPHPGNNENAQKENEYFSYIKKTPNLTFRLSWLQSTIMTDQYGEYKSYREKGSDTALTTDLIASAAKDSFDVAIIVSNDGDYAPAAKMIKEIYNKQIEVVYFPNNRPFVMEQYCLMREIRTGYLVGYNAPIKDVHSYKGSFNKGSKDKHINHKKPNNRNNRFDYEDDIESPHR